MATEVKLVNYMLYKYKEIIKRAKTLHSVFDIPKFFFLTLMMVKLMLLLVSLRKPGINFLFQNNRFKYLNCH